MNCIIIDDEPLAIKVIEKHLSMIEGFVVTATFNSALPVYKFLQSNKIDLIFLDLEMPNLSGLNFLKTLTNPPQVILTTAHREYALASYDYVVLDYLLKPISFERFLKAISKLNVVEAQQNGDLSSSQLQQNTLKNDYGFFKVDRRNIRINFDDIHYIESVKNHIKLVLSEAKHITHMNLLEIESKMDPHKFIRVHKSFIIALKYVQSYNSAGILINGQLIPIGRSYKVKVMEMLGKHLI